MADPQWGTYKIKLRALINDVSFTDIIQWSASFALNSIPVGTLALAVGRRVDTLQAATIHTLAANLSIKMPVQIFLTITQTGAAPGVFNQWPSGEFQVWEGYAMGTNWERAQGEAQFVIHLIHWLEDLNCSSAISATSHPNNPADFTFAAISPAMGPTSNAGGGEANNSDPTWIPMCDAQQALAQGDVPADLWMNCLQPWLVAIANEDRVNTAAIGGAGITAQEKNDAALAALKRMTNTAGAGCAYVPLALNMTGAEDSAVIAGLTSALTSETFESWVNTTLWGKLVGEWAPSFFFSIVPRILDARVIPFTGPLRQTWSTIRGVEYNYCARTSQLSQNLQAVGIYHSSQMLTGFNTRIAEYSQGVGFQRLAGWYSPPDADTKGLLLLKAPPNWLAAPVGAWLFSKDSTGAEGKVISTALDPGVGAGLPAGVAAPNQAIAGHTSPGGFFDRLAQQWFAMEMLKGCMLELSGMLRLDIAPGSNVQIECGAEQFIPGEDALTVPLFATVQQVSIVINSERQQAGTALSLAHVRTLQENNSDATSISQAPLYTTIWPGCTLADEVKPTNG